MQQPSRVSHLLNNKIRFTCEMSFTQRRIRKQRRNWKFLNFAPCVFTYAPLCESLFIPQCLYRIES